MSTIELVILSILVGSLFGVLIPYGLYPLVLIVLDRPRKRKTQAFTPPVTILLAAHNEAGIIAEKIKTTFQSHYPGANIKMIIGTDACDDETDTIIQSLAADDARIVHVPFEKRQGKVTIINQIKQLVQSEFIVATDANVLFEPNTLAQLMQHFQSPEVGLVAGHICYMTEFKGIANQERTYLHLENRLKLAESNRWDLMMGAEGGCFAIRTALMPTVPKNALVDDFYITMKTIAAKYQVIFEPKAICKEDVSISRAVEWQRKKRISAGNWQNINAFYTLFWQQPYPAGFAFFCHKILRWLTPFFLLFSLMALVAATFFWDLALGTLVLLGLLAGVMFLDHYLYKRGRTLAAARFIAHFFWMNYALFMGFIDYIKGIESNIWQRTQRNEE